MRLIVAFLVASLLAFLVFWGGARVARVVTPPDREHNDFTVGRKMNLCGRVIDTRHEVSGYDLEAWLGRRCDDLGSFDECLLDCLARAGTIEIGAACYSDCVERVVE